MYSHIQIHKHAYLHTYIHVYINKSMYTYATHSGAQQRRTLGTRCSKTQTQALDSLVAVHVPKHLIQKLLLPANLVYQLAVRMRA
jgi:hypothetical protein